MTVTRLGSAGGRFVESAGGRFESALEEGFEYGPGRINVQCTFQVTRAEVCAACADQGGTPGGDPHIPACNNCNTWGDATFCNGQSSAIGFSLWSTLPGTQQGTPFGLWLFSRGDWLFDRLINPPRCLGVNGVETLTTAGGNTLLNRERWIDTGLLGIGAIVTAREIIL